MIRFWISAAALWLGAGAAWGQSYQEARIALRENRVAESERMLAGVIADQAASPADRARALLLSSRIAWRIDGDLTRALAILDRAPAEGPEGCAAAQARARLLMEAQRSSELLAAADRLIARCESADEADGIRLHAAAAALDADQVEPARLLLQASGEETRTSMTGASLRLRLAVAQGDAEEALQAWRDYFWLGEGDMPQGVAARFGSASELFAKGLAGRASVEERLRLTDLLMRAGFAVPAERFAMRHRLAQQAPTSPLWIRAAAYFAARREFTQAELAGNRRLARGGEAQDVKAAYARMTDQLVAAAGGGGDPTAILWESYGLHGTFGSTGGFPSAHIGHIVQRDRQAVAQYGHRADIEFVAVDNMLANGFQSWLWDGEAQIGGWTSDGPVIVQVRSGYTSGPLGGWRLAQPGPQRQRVLDRQAERAAGDLRAVAGGRPATLAGMGDRLNLQVAAQILDRAEAASGAAGSLKRAFLDEYWRAVVQHSIMIHEGRHAIDRKLVVGLARMDDANLEYRAKLSELALADYPRMALANIVTDNVGDGRSHGEANARVMRELAAWIDKHRREVAGFDPAAPAMVQLDRLTDQQLRAIARSLDPIARSS